MALLQVLGCTVSVKSDKFLCWVDMISEIYDFANWLI